MTAYRKFYVSNLNGNDSNSGRSPSEAFASLHAVNKLKLKPGDEILLQCNSVFENQFLHIYESGTKEAPIVVSCYGEGKCPVIECNGQGIWYQDYGVFLDAVTHVKEGYVSSTILLYDAEYIIVKNIEITNKSDGITGEEYSAPHKMNRTGVSVIAKNKGTLHNINLKNLYIHDVNGNVYDKHMNNGGIYATAIKPYDEEKTGISKYDGFLIEDCYVRKTSRWGIAIGYTYKHSEFNKAELDEKLFEKYGNINVLIKNNYVKEVGGDGITVMYALNPIVEHNVCDCAAMEMNDSVYIMPENRKGKVAAAIWPWKCKNALFRFNNVVDTRLNQDGMAYDADSGDGTTYEYNYSRLNEGGCVMFCLEQSVNNVFCNNISEDDLGGTISPALNPDAYIAHNTFYIREGVPFVRNMMNGGNFIEEDNHFIKL